MAVGVTVMVAVTAAEPLLVAVKAGVLPAPEPASPMDGVELVQVKVLPAVVLVKADAATAALLQ